MNEASRTNQWSPVVFLDSGEDSGIQTGERVILNSVGTRKMRSLAHESVKKRTVSMLKEAIAGVLSGRVVGVTLVTTSSEGSVEMEVLCVPSPSTRHENQQYVPSFPIDLEQQAPGLSAQQ